MAAEAVEYRWPRAVMGADRDFWDVMHNELVCALRAASIETSSGTVADGIRPVFPLDKG